MLLLVDGYNLLHAWDDAAAGKKDREGLLALLNTFARVRRHEIIVVFDGGIFSWAEHQSYSKRVKVVYSGSVDDADTVLKDMLKQVKSSRTVLVSSDTEIAQWASMCDIVSIDSSGFLHVVKQRLHEPKKKKKYTQSLIYKRAGAGTPEVDKLMRQALEEMPIPQKESDGGGVCPECTDVTEKGSASERKMRRVLEKL